MPAITPAALRNLAVFLDTQVQAALVETRTTWQQVAVRRDANRAQGLYAALDELDDIPLKEGEGYEKTGFSSWNTSLRSQLRGLSYRIKKVDLRDDEVGLYQNLPARIARVMARVPQNLVFKVLEEGDTSTPGTWVDGKNLFADDHFMPNDTSITFDNRLENTALTAGNLQTAMRRMMEFPDSKGNALGLIPNRLIVPPALIKTAADITLAMTVSTGGANMFSPDGMRQMGMEPLIPIVVPELKNDPTVWYLAAVDDGGAGVIYQVTEDFRLIPNFDPDSPRMLYADEYEWVAKGEVVAGIGDPRRIIRCEG